MVWCSGMTDWAPASSVNELYGLFAPPQGQSEPQPYSQQAGQYGSTNSQSQYGSESGYQPKETNPQGQQNQYNNQQNYGGQQPYNQQQYNQHSSYNQNPYGQRNDGINEVRPMPKNWLVESILVTVMCCLVFGLVGIIYATKVESLYYAGDYEGAEQAAKNAKMWTAIGFFSVLVIGILYVFAILVFGISSAF